MAAWGHQEIESSVASFSSDNHEAPSTYDQTMNIIQGTRARQKKKVDPKIWFIPVYFQELYIPLNSQGDCERKSAWTESRSRNFVLPIVTWNKIVSSDWENIKLIDFTIYIIWYTDLYRWYTLIIISLFCIFLKYNYNS